ncbi:FkbM family methyltransferase [Candidatus Haliotispira prima]|uniref:FkbM family methyltransferase n=1 Tax=Candidatus Haliotispira prima TaxID=3034016 RepID=A0ABY8MMZ8_9SPIO|nr:FkbM family methyltransferase [Candidatus Haliotispira prima]
MIDELKSYDKVPEDIQPNIFSGPHFFTRHVVLNYKDSTIIPRALIVPDIRPVDSDESARHYWGIGCHHFHDSWGIKEDNIKYLQTREREYEGKEHIEAKGSGIHMYPKPFIKKLIKRLLLITGVKKLINRWKRLMLKEVKSELAEIKAGFVEMQSRLVEVKSELVEIKAKPANKSRDNKVYPSGDGTIIFRAEEGHHLQVLAGDRSVTPHAVDDLFERGHRLFIKKILRKGDWFVDAGANVGMFTHLAAQSVGRFGKVFAFEPNKVCADIIDQTTIINYNFFPIEIHNVALSDTEKSENFLFSGSNFGSASLAADSVDLMVPYTQKNLESRVVECKLLDSYIPDYGHIRCCKIDVEGYEAAVLRGAEKLISNYRIDYLLIEVYYEVCGYDRMKDLLEYIRRMVYDLGYSLFVIDDDGNCSEMSFEYLAVTQYAYALLKSPKATDH